MKNEFEIDGIVEAVEPPKALSTNFFLAKVILQIWKGQYSENVPFDFINRNTELIRDIQMGDKVHITFQISGRKMTNKNNEVFYVSSLQGLNISKIK